MKALDAMLPRLHAEEQLAAVNAVVLGMSPKNKRREAVAALERAAHGGGRRRGIVAGPETLKSHGINVTILPAKSAGESTTESGIG